MSTKPPSPFPTSFCPYSSTRLDVSTHQIFYDQPEPNSMVITIVLHQTSYHDVLPNDLPEKSNHTVSSHPLSVPPESVLETSSPEDTTPQSTQAYYTDY